MVKSERRSITFFHSTPPSLPPPLPPHLPHHRHGHNTFNKERRARQLGLLRLRRQIICGGKRNRSSIRSVGKVTAPKSGGSAEVTGASQRHSVTAFIPPLLLASSSSSFMAGGLRSPYDQCGVNLDLTLISHQLLEEKKKKGRGGGREGEGG